RMQHRHQELLAADRVHLLAHDLNDPLVDAPAGRQPAPQSRSDLANQAGADHQLVRDRLRVGGGLALSGKEILGEPGHRAFTGEAYPGRSASRSPRPRGVRVPATGFGLIGLPSAQSSTSARRTYGLRSAAPPV